jgi:cytochrome c-type biogenesis protein CcmH/NrfG
VVLAAGLLAVVVACAITYVSVVRTDRVERRFLTNQERGAALRGLRASESWLSPSTNRDQARAALLANTGHVAAAERSIARVVREQPRNVVAWLVLTQVQVTRGHFVMARASWARARELDPHLPSQLPAGFR